MTDKQKIIDKYTDCEYYNFSLGGICDQTTLSVNSKNCAKCSDIDGCFIKELYKKLKAKEQECERLREINCIYLIGVKQANELKETVEHKQAYINNVENYNEQLNQQLDQLKAENEQLKDEYKILEDNLDSRTRDFEDVIDSYKQTLAEIKEIAEGCQYGDCHECKYQPRTDCRTELIVQILQKISEVTDV